MTGSAGSVLHPEDFVVAIPTHDHRHSLLPCSRALRQVSKGISVIHACAWTAYVALLAA